MLGIIITYLRPRKQTFLAIPASYPHAILWCSQVYPDQSHLPKMGISQFLQKSSWIPLLTVNDCIAMQEGHTHQ